MKKIAVTIIAITFIFALASLSCAASAPAADLSSAIKESPKSQQVAPKQTSPFEPQAKISLPRTHVIRSYEPNRVYMGEVINVLGMNFGENKKGDLRMRIGGQGFGEYLQVEQWSPNQVRVRLPKNVKPGIYYIGVTDASGRWLSNIDQMLTVQDKIKHLPVTMAVRASCSMDVVRYPRTITVGWTSDNGTSPTAILNFARQRSGPAGTIFYDYTGQVDIRFGSYNAKDLYVTCDILFYDSITTPLCISRNRVNQHPLRETRSIRIEDSSRGIVVADDSSAIKVDGWVSHNVVDSSGGSRSISAPAGIDPLEK